jgi:TPR repeat protein
MKLKTLLLTVLLTTSLIGITYAAFSDGWKAYQAKDYVAAFKEWKPLAKQGESYAQFNLGNMYKEGKGVAQDYKQALRWYRKAADQGHSKAQFNLGNMYFKGKGVAQDYKQAVKWYRKAAKQGDSRAQFGLGLIYDIGKGVLRDPKQAVNWYQKAAEQGYSRAQYNLGVMYTDQGGLKDMTKAKYWIKKAYEADDAKISKSAEQTWNVYELWKY